MADNKELNEEIITKIKELPVKERVKAVALYHHLQRKQNLEEELEKKVDALQKEFDQKCLPLYAKQNEIINGLRGATAEELTLADKYVNDNEKTQIQEVNVAEPLENYWYKALKTSHVMTDVCHDNDKDWEVLQHLEKVELQLEDANNNYSLIFTFKENEYFTNTVISKQIIYPDDSKEEPIKSHSTQIEWKEGKNITIKKVTKKQKNKKTGASRNVTKEIEADSFFNFFKDFDLSNKEDLDEEEVEHHENRMNDQLDIATEFIESIIPCSLELYLGLQPEMAELEDFGEGDDDDGDDDEDDEDDNKKKKHHKKSGDNTKPEKPDCKQQ